MNRLRQVFGIGVAFGLVACAISALRTPTEAAGALVESTPIVRRRRPRARRGVGMLVAIATVATGFVLTPALTDVASAATKVTICHRTHSTTNPYRKITVSQSAAQNSRHGGHDLPDGSANPAVYDNTFTYASNNKYWGDIIPGSTSGGSALGGSNGVALNWDAAGIAAFSTYCAPMTAKQFYDIETTDGGQSAADVVADLNDMDANEDEALLASIGGTFSTSNVSTWATAVSVSTSAATSVAATTATLNGSITVGTVTGGMARGFDYGTSSTLGTFTSVSAGSNLSGVTNQAISANLTGLTGGTTYYFRATGTTNAGTETEGILYGSILSFTTTGNTAQSITFNQPANMVLGDAAQNLTNTTANTSGLAVTFTSNSTSICTVSGTAVTAVSEGTCSITASQAGDTTYAPATSVTRTFTITGTARTLTIDSASYASGGYALNATPPTITSTANLGNTTGTKSYSSSTTGVCTINASSGLVAFVSAGDCTIGSSITAGGIYNSATASTVTFPLTAVSRTLAINGASYNASGYALNATPPTIASTANLGDSDGTKSFSSSTTGVCTVNASSGLVAFVSAGDCTIGSSITAGGIYNSATASTVTFPLTAVSRTLAINGGSYVAGGYALNATPPTILSTANLGDNDGTKSYSSSTTGVCTINSSTGVVTFVAGGDCTIGSSITAGGIYNSATATTVTFPLTLVTRTLTIDSGSYASGGYALNATPPTIASTANLGNTTGTKSYSSSTTGVCTINSSTGVVTFVAAGTCTIGASITASGIYNSATASTISFTLTAVSRTLTIDSTSYAAGGYQTDATPPTITSTANLGNTTGTKSYSSSTTGVCTINSSTGVVTFVAAGTCTIGASITASGIYNSATATTVSFPLTAPPAPTTTTTAPPTTTTVPPTTTTTVPPTTTTTPGTGTPVTPAADGTVRGVVWFDRNNNTSFDGREWILAGVQIQLTQILTPSVTPASGESGFQTAAFVPAATPLSYTVTTDKDGKYVFSGLPFSQYSVSAVANIKGFDYTSDTDGNADWNVSVSVTSPGVPGIGDFAGLGKGQIIGQMFEQQTGEGLAFATIRCMWSGYDDVLGNGDDAPFELPADAEGRFDMAGIPYGNFSCSGVDGAGRRSAAVLAAVFSPEPQRAPLPVVRDAAALPQTGGNVVRALLVALLSLGLGATLTVSSRRHRRQTV
jgi:hypothetical protein